MAKNVTQYDLLISCPGDIQSEVEIIKQIVEDFNEKYSDTLGISLRVRHWKKSSYAQSGGKPQALLNEQFVEQCDAAVAVFWTRFGTPTDEYGSGAEEEIELMLKAGKQVFMYFSDKPIPPSKQDPTEYAKINAFRAKYKDRGLYFTYSSDDEFSKLFTAHLAQHFLTVKKIDELKESRSSHLILRGIDENQALCDEASIHHFMLGFEKNFGRYIEEIRQMYQDIANLRVGSRTSNIGAAVDKYLASFNPPVTITDERKNFLTQMATALDISLPDDFFELGNLSKDGFSGASILGSPHLKGTEDEKRKYDLLQTLYDSIFECSKQGKVEDAFSGIKCIKLAIENDGTTVDEDIEITITLSAHDLLTIDKFPQLDNHLMDFLLNEGDMDRLFGILGTAQFMEYESAMRPLPMGNYTPSFGINSLPFIGETADYSEDYENKLLNIFPYEVYPDKENYICKLRFDYIKHHTVVAFPTPLLLKGIPKEIMYTITSKNAADVIHGTISVVDKTSKDI